LRCAGDQVRGWRDSLRAFSVRIGVIAFLLPLAILAQTADFQIVWINVGEVAAASEGRQVRAGRQLFMAPDLVQFSLNKVTVARVEVAPEIVSIKPGERFCLTSLHVTANGDDHKAVDNAPITISVRQDQRERLSMRRAKNNICFSPTSPGEYPVRFNSLLPAHDGTTRGAQIFLRVGAQEDVPEPAVSAASQISLRPVRSSIPAAT
jgi:hypothetical protein